jgi:DNA polymerase-1
MINVDRRLKEEAIDARMILQVHDELIIEAHRDFADRAATILREEMEAAAKLPVPLSVELSIGSRWYET